MNSKTIIVLLLVAVTASALVCPKDFCQRVDCSNKIQKDDCEQNNNGVYKEHGTWCGCCPACLTKIDEGGNCLATLVKGPPAKAACAPGLTCDTTTEKCVKESI